ncbi:MAG: HEAT repeat domain-containing protein, partial [Bacillota bacterium]|nr:HEAT repeat domain-containing protein [Bacillota bacterium]
MKKLSRVLLSISIATCVLFGLPAQSGGAEKTVEESYLQESLETMIIKEQSLSENRDMKVSALKFIKQAIDDGRQNPEIEKSLEYLALETTNVIIRTGGLGRPTNDYP